MAATAAAGRRLNARKFTTKKFTIESFIASIHQPVFTNEAQAYSLLASLPAPLPRCLLRRLIP
ncbi:MAG: hypothetical protein ACLQFW_03550 [Xanthobacteraceae bacterium]